MTDDTITCPVCRMTSHNPNDVAQGYCGHCHAFTSPPSLAYQMSQRQQQQRTDPRRAGGQVISAGGPRDRHSSVIDAHNAVILEAVEVVLVEPYRDGQAGAPTLAMTLSGHINKTPERTSILYLFDEDGAAAIVTELIALAARIGPEFLARTLARLDDLKDA